MAKINFFSIIKQNLSLFTIEQKTNEIPEDNAMIKKSLFSTATDFGTTVQQQRAISSLSAKIH